MKSRLLALLAATTLAGGGLAFSQTGGLAPRSRAAAVRPDDPLASDQGRRFARNQPLHWRDVALPR
jgi:hypothetical protein